MSTAPSFADLVARGNSHPDKTYAAGVLALDTAGARRQVHLWLSSLSSQPAALQSRLLDTSKTVQLAVVS